MKSHLSTPDFSAGETPTVPFRVAVEPGEWLLVTRGPLAGTWLKFVQRRKGPYGEALILDVGEQPSDGACLVLPVEWCSALPRLAWWRRLKVLAVARLARWLTGLMHREAVIRERARAAAARQSYLDLAAENAELRLELIEAERMLFRYRVKGLHHERS